MDYAPEAVDLASKFPFAIGDAEYICRIGDVCNIPQNQRLDFIEWCAELYVLKTLPSIDYFRSCCHFVDSLFALISDGRVELLTELITASIEASLSHRVTELEATHILTVIRWLPEEIKTKLFLVLLEHIDSGVSFDRIINVLSRHVVSFNPEDYESFVDDVIEDVRGHRLTKVMKRLGLNKELS